MCARSQIFFWGIETGGLFYKAMHASDLRVLETKSPEFARKNLSKKVSGGLWHSAHFFHDGWWIGIGLLMNQEHGQITQRVFQCLNKAAVVFNFRILVKPWVIYSVNHVYLTFDRYAEITFRKKWILELSTLFPNFKHSREDFRSQVPTCDGMY